MSYTPNTTGDYKNSVRAASTGNVTISSPGATIDGVSLSVGDRVLLKDQATGSQNGIYEWEGAATSMRRAPDANQSAELTAGLMVTVSEGSTNADTTWIITTDDPITVDVTAIAFGQISGGGGASVLNDLTDVNTTGLVDGSLLRYESTGSEWQPTTASNLLLTDAGLLQVPTDGASAGIQIGSDTNLYRSSANVLKTDDAVAVDGTYVHLDNAANPAFRLSTEGGASGVRRAHFALATSANAFLNGAAAGDTVIAAKSGGSLRLGTSATDVAQTTIMEIETDGTVNFGSATSAAPLTFAADTNLYRDAADVLKTDDSFEAVGDITARSSLYPAKIGQTTNGYGLQFTGPAAGVHEWYELSSSTMATRSSIRIQEAGTNSIDLLRAGGITMRRGTPTINQNAATSTATNLWVARISGESQNRLQVRANSISFGGGSSGVDWSMSYTGANTVQLGTSDQLQVQQDPVANDDLARKIYVDNAISSAGYVLDTGDTMTGDLTMNEAQVLPFTANATTAAMRVAVTGDTAKRFRLYGDGKIDWGDGTSTPDTTLYRSAANTLKTDDSFIANGNIEATTGDIDAVAGDVRASTAFMGDWPANSAYAVFGHESHIAANNYALLQAATGGHTFLNAASGGTLYLRINNSNMMTMAGSTVTLSATSFTTSVGTYINQYGASAASQVHYARASGDTQVRYYMQADGTMNFGDGASAADVSIGRSAANTLQLGAGDQLQVQQDPSPSAQNDVTRRAYVDHRAFFLGG